MNFKSSFLQEASWRGFIYQGTDLEALDDLMSRTSITAYIGFDATAPSLHVGNLVQILRLRLLQKHGHRPLVLMGDGTTRIGDPSGKDAMRQMLDEESIEKNVQSIQRVFEKYLKFGTGSSDATLLRNSHWLLELNYIDFLRTYGRHFSINRMLTFESVKARLEREQPLSLIEFNYMIFQAYDFLYLNKHQNCLLQLGGSDQWGNIVCGTDLIRRAAGKTAYGLTGELITTSDGRKMGKTAQGAVWLNADMISPYDFWQFWRNTQDDDVVRFLKLFTDLERDEIERLATLEGAELNDAKVILANEATRLCHGDDAVRAAQETAASVFSGNAHNLEDLPSVTLMNDALSLIDALVELQFAKSKGEARRLIRGNGVRVADQIVLDEELSFTKEDLKEGPLKISAGKKRHGLLKANS